MDEQSCENRYEVHPQLLRKDRRIMHVQDLPSNQKYDSKWEVPVQRDSSVKTNLFIWGASTWLSFTDWLNYLSAGLTLLDQNTFPVPTSFSRTRRLRTAFKLLHWCILVCIKETAGSSFVLVWNSALLADTCCFHRFAWQNMWWLSL